MTLTRIVTRCTFYTYDQVAVVLQAWVGLVDPTGLMRVIRSSRFLSGRKMQCLNMYVYPFFSFIITFQTLSLC